LAVQQKQDRRNRRKTERHRLGDGGPDRRRAQPRANQVAEDDHERDQPAVVEREAEAAQEARHDPPR